MSKFGMTNLKITYISSWNFVFECMPLTLMLPISIALIVSSHYSAVTGNFKIKSNGRLC